MKLEILGLLVLASLPNMVAADDLASQFATAHAAFLGTTVGTDPLEQRQFMAQMLSDLTGTWLPVGFLSPGDDMLAEERILETCARPGSVFAFTAPTSNQFLMTRADGQGTKLTFYYDYLWSNRFQLRVDIQEYLTYFEVPADSLQHPFGLFGAYALFHPSPDVLVLLPETREADIYLRCPE